MFYVYHIFKCENVLSEGYIGVSINPEKRFEDHCKGDMIVGRAIRKHNLNYKNNVKILAVFNNEEDAYNYEKKLRPQIKIGWNIGIGGMGGARPISEKARQKAKERIGPLNPRYGKINDSNMRKKISNALLAKPEDWRKFNSSKAGKGLLGYKRTEKTKQKFKEIAANRPKYTCPHCKKEGQYNSMISYHGDNCKNKSGDFNA